MIRTDPSLAELDLEIAVASIALGMVRTAEEHCPSAENSRRVAEARAEVDGLLDRRLAAVA